MSKMESLMDVESASEDYLSAKARLENSREVLAEACRSAHASGATHREISIRTPYTRQRISQFLSDSDEYRE